MKDYFCGWYFKMQNGRQTIALIPAYHIANGEKSCSIQMIRDNGSWNIPFPFSQYGQDRDRIQIGSSLFARGYCLTVRRLEKKGYPLAAPVAGKMSRTIHETAACRVFYHFQIHGETCFAFESDQASFEYEFAR